MLFLSHPIQTQAVTYIAQRFASLATLFYLAAVLLYVKWRLSKEEERQNPVFFVGALLSGLLAMKTKQISFTLPLLILIIELFFFSPFGKKKLLYVTPFFLALLLTAKPYLFNSNLGESTVLGIEIPRETASISRLDYLLTQSRVLVTYVRLLIMPVGQNLDYDYKVFHSFLNAQVLLSFGFLALLVLAAVLFLVKSKTSAFKNEFKLISFGITWFVVTLLPESSVFPIRDVIFEHRLYLPSFGFFLAATGAILAAFRLLRSRLAFRDTRPLAIVLLLIIALLAFATYQRNQVWRNPVTIWEDVVAKSPKKARAHMQLGVAYNAVGRLDDAIREHKIAIKKNPGFYRTYYNLGNVYLKQGEYDKAITQFGKALSIRPDFKQAYYNLGIAYKETGRLREAAQAWELALMLDPGYSRAIQALNLLPREASQAN